MDNDVWGTLTALGGKYLDYKRDVAIASRTTRDPGIAGAATRSTPSGDGTGGQAQPNKFPGTFGPYPQAETKKLVSDVAGSPWMIVVGILLAVLLVLRFARR